MKVKLNMKNNGIENFIKTKYAKEESLENFIKWFGKSKICEENDYPLTLYHGTTHDFSTFSSDFHWKESFAGKGFYFTSSSDDASENYASLEGPDIKNKIDNEIDELRDLDDYDYAGIFDIEVEEVEDMSAEDMEKKIKEHVLERLAGNNIGNIIPVHLRMEKPLILDINNGTEFDWNIDMSGNAVEIEGLLEKTVKKYSNIESYIDSCIVYEEIKQEILMTDINNVEELLTYLEDKNDDFNSLKEDNEEEFYIFFNELKTKIISHYGGLESSIEIEERFSGELFEFFEYLENYIENKYMPMMSDNTPESLILKIHEEIDFETFCDNVVNVQSLKKSIERIEEFSCLENYDDDSIFSFSNVLNEFARIKKYDGIIMNPMDTHFSNMNHINHCTKHYIVFDPNQIKSAVGNSGDYSLTHDDICHRISINKKPIKPLDDESIEKIINDFKDIFNIKIELITDVLETTKGFSKDKVIYINNENIENERDLIQTINHETFHIGFREKFGKNGKIYLDKAFKLFEKTNELEDIKEKYKLNFSKPADRLRAAEEKIAEMAESGGELPFGNNLKGMIKNITNELEIKIKNKIDFDYKEIEMIILESFKSLSQSKRKENKYLKPKSRISL